jgi:hypothetical protein
MTGAAPVGANGAWWTATAEGAGASVLQPLVEIVLLNRNKSEQVVVAIRRNIGPPGYVGPPGYTAASINLGALRSMSAVYNPALTGRHQISRNGAGESMNHKHSLSLTGDTL